VNFIGERKLNMVIVVLTKTEFSNRLTVLRRENEPRSSRSKAVATPANLDVAEVFVRGS